MLLVATTANALKLEITKGHVSPDPIAIVDFKSNEQNVLEICDIIRNDLAFSGLFDVISQSNFLENSAQLVTKGPNIKNWTIINARFLVYGEAVGSVIEFVLVDVIAGRTMLKEKVKINKLNYRETAHIIADKIYSRITNEEGYFNTKIIYVTTASQTAGKRNTKLMIMDQDGYNAVTLTKGTELVLSPRCAPDSNILAYISYSNTAGALGHSAHVYTMDTHGHNKRLLINEKLLAELVKKNSGNPVNMTYAPRFSFDGLQAVLAIIINGNSAIYKLDIASQKLVQLTSHGNHIDTSPCFSPNGKQIVFTSDRAGKEAIYVMNSDGSNQHKISTGTGKYSQPVWSPRGDLIAFTKQEKNRFYIGVMKPDGTGERLIVNNYLVESPVWSSNGRYVVYTQQNSYKTKSQIAMTDLTGRYHRLIPTSGDASNPAWTQTQSKES